jgi:RNA polymerase sigma-70 factor (ECF subfamily)
MQSVDADSSGTAGLLGEAAAGDAGAVEKLLTRVHPQLVGFVGCRVRPSVRARFSSSDVVQEAQIEIVRRMDDYLSSRPMPFHLWVRKIAYQRLLNMQRDHSRRAKRSVGRESLLPSASSACLARPLFSKEPSPSSHLIARETSDRIGEAVAELAESDREILLMRHVEDLPYEEIASCSTSKPPPLENATGAL